MSAPGGGHWWTVPDERPSVRRRLALLGAVAAVGWLLVIGLVVALILLAAGCAPGADDARPGPASSGPAGPASPDPSAAPPDPGASTGRAGVAGPVEAALDAAWLAGRHGCGEPTQIAVDDLAAALIERLDAPRLDARLAAGAYVRARCPG